MHPSTFTPEPKDAAIAASLPALAAFVSSRTGVPVDIERADPEHDVARHGQREVCQLGVSVSARLRHGAGFFHQAGCRGHRHVPLDDFRMTLR